MKICPVAIAVGCRKCPVFSVCPAKGVIGDFKAEVKEAVKHTEDVDEAMKQK